MGYKVFDFVCTDPECKQYGEPKELMVSEEDVPECKQCMSWMKREMPAPMGRVSTFEVKNLKRGRSD